MALAIAFAAVCGLIVGSFLNVVVYRLPRGESLTHPRSRCPSCATQLRAIDNIPVVSWLALRGKCHHCDRAANDCHSRCAAARILRFDGAAHTAGCQRRGRRRRARGRAGGPDVARARGAARNRERGARHSDPGACGRRALRGAAAPDSAGENT